MGTVVVFFCSLSSSYCTTSSCSTLLGCLEARERDERAKVRERQMERKRDTGGETEGGRGRGRRGGEGEGEGERDTGRHTQADRHGARRRVSDLHKTSLVHTESDVPTRVISGRPPGRPPALKQPESGHALPPSTPAFLHARRHAAAACPPRRCCPQAVMAYPLRRSRSRPDSRAHLAGLGLEYQSITSTRFSGCNQSYPDDNKSGYGRSGRPYAPAASHAFGCFSTRPNIGNLKPLRAQDGGPRTTPADNIAAGPGARVKARAQPRWLR